jgi:hypothetical protein
MNGCNGDVNTPRQDACQVAGRIRRGDGKPDVAESSLDKAVFFFLPHRSEAQAW